MSLALLGLDYFTINLMLLMVFLGYHLYQH